MLLWDDKVEDPEATGKVRGGWTFQIKGHDVSYVGCPWGTVMTVCVRSEMVPSHNVLFWLS